MKWKVTTASAKINLESGFKNDVETLFQTSY